MSQFKVVLTIFDQVCVNTFILFQEFLMNFVYLSKSFIFYFNHFVRNVWLQRLNGEVRNIFSTILERDRYFLRSIFKREKWWNEAYLICKKENII